MYDVLVMREVDEEVSSDEPSEVDTLENGRDEEDVQELEKRLKVVEASRDKHQRAKERYARKEQTTADELDRLGKQETLLKKKIGHHDGQSPVSARHMESQQEFEDQLDEAPGPQCLRWVEGPCFSMFSACVVLLNLVHMMLTKFWLIDAIQHTLWFGHVFIIFYVVELTVKALFWRGLLLFRPCSEVWANWLDLIIVASAIIDSYLIPLCVDGHQDSDLGVLRIARIFRLFRLFRVCKMFNFMRNADARWVESDEFHTFMLVVISFNCLYMGFQEDDPSLTLWIYADNLVLAIFLVELVARLQHYGWGYFYDDDWVINWIDVIIVVGGALDMWLIPMYSFICTFTGAAAPNHHDLSQVMKTLRLLRLIRLLRLFRLVKGIPQLFELLTGIIDAMQSMGWILLLTIVSIYLVALVAMKLVGIRGLLLPHDAPTPVRETFPSILTTMWALFMAMNGDVGAIQPLLEEYPAPMIIVTALYMVFSSFAILSVLTGVVCDKMAKAADDNQEKLADFERKEFKHHAGEVLQFLYSSVSKNRPEMTKEEFQTILDDPDMCDQFCEVTGFDEEFGDADMEPTELRDRLQAVWTCYSTNIASITGYKRAVITKKTFMEDFLKQKNPVTEVNISRIENHLCGLEIQMDVMTQALQQIAQKMNVGAPPVESRTGSESRYYRGGP